MTPDQQALFELVFESIFWPSFAMGCLVGWAGFYGFLFLLQEVKHIRLRRRGD